MHRVLLRALESFEPGWSEGTHRETRGQGLCTRDHLVDVAGRRRSARAVVSASWACRWILARRATDRRLVDSVMVDPRLPTDCLVLPAPIHVRDDALRCGFHDEEPRRTTSQGSHEEAAKTQKTREKRNWVLECSESPIGIPIWRNGWIVRVRPDEVSIEKCDD